MGEGKCSVDLKINVREILDQNNFCLAGEWIKQNVKPFYKTLNDSFNEKTHFVYIWVYEYKDIVIPIYVGRCSKGISKRMKEHISGMGINGSISGGNKKRVFDEIFKEENKSSKVKVYARIPSVFSTKIYPLLKLNISEDIFMNEIITKHLSFSSIEEDIFIQLFREVENENSIFLPMNGFSDNKFDKFIKQLNS
jgi:hypothetical protein